MSSGQGLEAFVGDQFIYQQLVNDATLLGLMNAAYAAQGQAQPADPEIYADTIPPTVTYPYIVYQMHTPTGDVEVPLTGMAIVMSGMDYLIRVIDRGQSYATIAPIYSRVHQLLHGKSGGVASGAALMCYRIRPIKLPQLDDAVQYRIMGGLYRILAQS